MAAFFVGVLVASFLVQMSVWWLALRRAAFFNFQEDARNDFHPKTLPPVSVLICARNEGQNLKNFLPQILQQNYPDFEVIVVDDASDDDSAIILKNLQLEYSHLCVITIFEKKQRGKKQALTAAINSARNDTVLLTDADCVPATLFWIRGMVAKTSDRKKIVLGVSPYRPTKKTLLHTFIRHETTFTALQYIGFALAGMPYMGVGRNVLYSKRMFENVNGFLHHEHITAGDDDLFLNAVLTPNNFSVALDPATFTFSLPKNTWRDYLKQKARHVSVSPNYRFLHKIVLMMFNSSHFLFYLSIFFCVELKISTIFVLSIFVTRQLVILLLYKCFANRLKDKNLEATFLLFDVLLVLYNSLLGFLTVYRFNNWK